MEPRPDDPSTADRPARRSRRPPRARKARKARPDARLVPVALACWAGAAAAVSGAGASLGGALALALSALLAAGVLAAVLLIVTGRARRLGWLLVASAVALAVAFGDGLLHRQALDASPVAALAATRAVATVRVELTGDPTVRSGGVRPPFLIRRGLVREVDGRGQRWGTRTAVDLTVSGDALSVWERAPLGTELTTTVRFEPADPGAAVAATARIRGPTAVVRSPGPAASAVERVRSGLRAAVAHRSAEQRALVPALVLGDTSAVTDALREDFRITALTHLMAVSGANLTLLLAFVLVAARWLGVRGWWLRALAVLTVAVFVGLCRSEPSVLRAAAMGLVVLVALGLSAGESALRHLALAAVVLLLVDPWLATSYGFVLSVLASGGIVCWARRWTEVLAGWCPRLLAESVTVPVAAHLATLPVVAVLSGRVSLVGVLANLCAAPAVAPATVLGFAAAGLSLAAAPLAALAGFGAAWSAQLILWVAHAGARLPGASTPWPTTPVAITLLAVAALLVATAMPVVLRSRWLTGAVAVLMLVVVLRPAVVPGWPGADWAVVACDVGQGDGVVVRVGAGQAVVFDAGPDPAPMRTCLDQLAVRAVPLLVFTHFHADHVGGLTGVFAGRRVGQIWTCPYPSPPEGAAAVAAAAASRGIAVRVPAVGEQIAVGPVRLDVVGPVIRFPLLGPIAAEDSSSQQNEESLVVRVTTPELTLLETGDVEPLQQAAVLAATEAAGGTLAVDVLKIPHHGSANQDPAFIAASRAAVAIASAGLHNDYGHPAPRTVRLVEGDGMTLLRTDRQGSVAVGRDRGRLVALAQKQAPPG
ncbi:competence protein ComEC [Friedmanniella endophytica]|uniref:Competence protein ComEC n=1 Tax=Microlunatus kandeliicorticis TaxID=1759536 RepID=A0A7W3IV61_9ACTN|nr:ComEC/Rec2 family competence protein [Microlunatus kandeliicorticis]MBA8795861.1 competence protein ComEC [Microlunatus kandeliicorticis]